ncbi:MAG: NAD-dependent succinate-semialdehyde dehydrogenase [Vicinamibacterales bacterium]
MALLSINPATGEQIDAYPEMTPAEVEEALAEARAAFLDWRRASFDTRAALLKSLAAELRLRTPALARLMALEMGKPVAQGESEVQKCASACDYFAAHGAPFLAGEEIATDARRSFVTCQPLGVVLGVMPWNFPFWQVFRYAAPALLAGNASVLKHASNVTACALAIEDVFRTAGAPPGLFRTLRLGSGRVGDIIDDSRIAAVTVTGSTRAGRAVAARAGQAIKKTVLELGGSDPYLILDDADLPAAVHTCVSSRLINSGQSCIAAKRFIVTERRVAEVERLFTAEMTAQRMGDPMTPGVDVGPQARHDLRDALHRQVMESVARGARLLLGGQLPEGPGAFYPPSILTDVKRGTPAHDEELFGPVAAIIVVGDEAEQIRVANDSTFGLGAAVFTTDLERGTRIAAEEIEAGNCFVNAFVRSDPRLPFGGIKESGYGRELGPWGVREFVNIKTVYVDAPGGAGGGRAKNE